MLPPRPSTRRTSVPRWLVIPFALTIIALLVDASVHARSPKVQATLSSFQWVDKVLPQITASTAQGNEIALVSTAALPAGAEAASKELDTVAANANSTYRYVVNADPPVSVSSADGLLQACLDARKQGAAAMASAVHQLLNGEGANAAVAQMTAAVADFEVGDSAYRLFEAEVPKLGATVPSSRWVNPGSYQTPALLAFAHRLLAARPKAPAQTLALDSVSTTPTALSLQGKTEVLSPASSFSVTAVVADNGQSSLHGVIVSATVSPAQGGPSQQVSSTVDLTPGQATAVALPGLRPPLSVAVTVTVSASLAGASQPSASKQLQVELPGPNFSGAPATTTTAPAATTTTAPATTTTAPAATTTAPATTAPATTAPATTAPATTAPATTAPATTARPTTTSATTTTSAPKSTTST